MNEKELKAAVIEAGEDEYGAAVRQELCQALTAAFRKTGEVLWLGGYLIGPDRVDGA